VVAAASRIDGGTERHLYLIMPPRAETSPVAAAFADAVLAEALA
jgi:hypothetical protein